MRVHWLLCVRRVRNGEDGGGGGWGVEVLGIQSCQSRFEYVCSSSSVGSSRVLGSGRILLVQTSEEEVDELAETSDLRLRCL